MVDGISPDFTAQSKRQRHHIMASDVITPYGRLQVPARISGEEMRAAGVTRQDASDFLEYDGKDNWRDAEKMCIHIHTVVLPMFELIFPRIQGVFLYDNATNHSCFADDALNAYKIQMTPGGVQPKMREGFGYNRMMQQAMQEEKGVPKGML